MKCFIWTTAACAALVAGGAQAGSPKYDDKVEVFKGTGDKFDSSYSFPGKINYKNKLLGTSADWQIRGWVTKDTQEARYQLYVDLDYSGDWKNFDTAADDTAHDLKVVEIDHHVGDCSNTLLGCDLSETVGINLSTEDLLAHALIGFQVRLLGHDGTAIVMDITPAQIQSALLTANQWLPPEKQWTVENAQALLSAIVAHASQQAPAPPAQAPNGRAPLGISFLPHPIIVTITVPGSVADKAGVQKFDIIQSINGTDTPDQAALMSVLGKISPGQQVTATVRRGTEIKSLTLQF